MRAVVLLLAPVVAVPGPADPDRTALADPDAVPGVAAAVLPTLRALLVADGADEPTMVRRQAATRAVVLLGRHAAPALPELRRVRTLPGIQTWEYVAACDAVGPDGVAHVLAVLDAVAQERDPPGVVAVFTPTGTQTRRAALESLAHHPALGSAAVRTFTDFLSHDDPVTRCLAAYALAGQGPDAAPSVPDR